MKVSIITPCYNASPYITRTILSVQNQTITDWEMIVIDDGSTDNSAEIVKNLAKEDPRIKLFQKENGGSASARNVGLAIAQGKFIQFLDADDTIESSKLERQINLMEQKGLDVTYTDYCMVNQDGSFDKEKGHNFNLFKLLIGWGVFGTIPFHAFVYRLEFLLNNNIFSATEVREREDWDFHIKVFSAHPMIQRLKNYCGAFYFRCPTGKTSSGSLTKIKRGTLNYILYKIKHTTGLKRFLLQLRLSTELIEVTMAYILRNVDIKQISPLFKDNSDNLKSFVFSLILSPLALPIYICRFVWVHTR